MNRTPQSSTRSRRVLAQDEPHRLATLYALDVLGGSGHDQFDRFGRLACRLFDVPITTISFIDAERERFRSQVGSSWADLPRELSFANHAVIDNEILVVEDATCDLRFFDSPLVRSESIRFCASYPVRAWNGANVGAFTIMDRQPRSLGEEHRDALRDLAAAVEHEISARELALIDELTGFVNHRGLAFAADHIIPRAIRDGETISILFIDFEDLDSINEAYGRAAGDAALATVADVLRSTLRVSDIPARMRADDFAVFLPNTDRSQVDVVLKRIQDNLDARLQERPLPFKIALRISKASLDPSEENFTLSGLISVANTVL